MSLTCWLWILNSRASKHMSYNYNLFNNIITLPLSLSSNLAKWIQGKDNKSRWCSPQFKANFTWSAICPQFKFNLILIHSLTAQSIMSNINFSALSCILQAPSMKRLEIGRARNGILPLHKVLVSSNFLFFIFCCCVYSCKQTC